MSVMTSHLVVSIISAEIIFILDLSDLWWQNLKFEEVLRQAMVPMMDKVQVQLLKAYILGSQLAGSILVYLGCLSQLYLVIHVLSEASWDTMLEIIKRPRYGHLGVVLRVSEMVFSLEEVVSVGGHDF